MIIRNIGMGNSSDEDLEAIDDIYEKYYKNQFGLPNLNATVSHGIIEDDKGVIGFGMVKLFAEAIMILDKIRSTRDKSRAMKALMYKALADSKRVGLNQLHVTVDDEEFAKKLEKHYGFKRVRSIVLVRNL